MKRGIVIGWLGVCLATIPALGEPPTIWVTWDGPDPPESPYDYEIINPASDFPDVELKSESDKWLIWSEDSENPNGIGDIGIISSPHPENFGVKIEGPGEIAGAREIKGIILDPQGEGSDAKYSNLTGRRISGNLNGGLTLQESGGQGGVASFTIEGNTKVHGDNILTLTYLSPVKLT